MLNLADLTDAFAGVGFPAASLAPEFTTAPGMEPGGAIFPGFPSAATGNQTPLQTPLHDLTMFPPGTPWPGLNAPINMLVDPSQMNARALLRMNAPSMPVGAGYYGWRNPFGYGGPTGFANASTGLFGGLSGGLSAGSVGGFSGLASSGIGGGGMGPPNVMRYL